jgi:Transglutaminase-like superfamily
METYLQFGLYTKDCPQWLIDKIKDIKPDKIDEGYIAKILRAIKDEFDPQLHAITTTHDFKTSRFISVKDVLAKRQSSCGSLATVAASVLRSLNIPTKLIDGKFIKDDPRMQHAWNGILINNEWKPFDITRQDFSLTPYHIKLGEYVDWSDLEEKKKGIRRSESPVI